MDATAPSWSQGMEKEKKAIRRELRPEALKCPRCNSCNTKFCYYNNYNLCQPRYFCKTCRRYWTAGGSLRNVPVGGGSRKTKPKIDDHMKPSSSSVLNPNQNTHNGDEGDHLMGFFKTGGNDDDYARGMMMMMMMPATSNTIIMNDGMMISTTATAPSTSARQDLKPNIQMQGDSNSNWNGGGSWS